MKLRVAGITTDSVVDGPGIRFVIFAQGCLHQCPGCHNPKTHDPEGGTLMDTEEIFSLICKAKLIRGVTLSGGEPFMQAKPLAYLAGLIKGKGFDVVTYTGFLFEQLVTGSYHNKEVRQLLANTDILIDGPYHEAERDLGLAFRGSRNQRLINVPHSLARNRVVLWEDSAARLWA